MTETSDRVLRAQRLVEAALDRKAEDVLALDVREQSSFADTFLLATGTSDRHVRAICDAMERAAKEEGETVLGVEGYTEGRWILLDLADIVVHLFQADVRTFYDLERLWSEAPAMELDLPAAEASQP